MSRHKHISSHKSLPPINQQQPKYTFITQTHLITQTITTHQSTITQIFISSHNPLPPITLQPTTLSKSSHSIVFVIIVHRTVVPYICIFVPLSIHPSFRDHHSCHLSFGNTSGAKLLVTGPDQRLKCSKIPRWHQIWSNWLKIWHPWSCQRGTILHTSRNTRWVGRVTPCWVNTSGHNITRDKELCP